MPSTLSTASYPETETKGGTSLKIVSVTTRWGTRRAQWAVLDLPSLTCPLRSRSLRWAVRLRYGGVCGEVGWRPHRAGRWLRRRGCPQRIDQPELLEGHTPRR